VAERFVSVGDFVTTGTRVVAVVRIDPLRVLLTVPEQLVSQVKAGQAVTFGVDAHPGRQFQGTVRFISPALRAEQRALTVEAVVENPDGQLLPGLFVTAQLERPSEQALLVDRRAIREVGQTSRVFVVSDDRLEERIVRLGQEAGSRIEIVSGVDAGAVLALPGDAVLSEGLRVRPLAATPARPAP
jgi:membrane fusion protein (multidrug efflux system)